MPASGSVNIKNGSDLDAGIDVFAGPTGACQPFRIWDNNTPPNLLFALTSGGNVQTKALITATIPNQTASYIMSSADCLIQMDATAGNSQVYLVPAFSIPSSIQGRWVRIEKIDASANLVTIVPNGGDTIDGASTLVLKNQFSYALLVSDGNGHWYSSNPLRTSTQTWQSDATDSAVSVPFIFASFRHRSTGTPLASFGCEIDFGGDSSANTNRKMGRIISSWKVPTDGSTNGQIELDAALGNSFVQCLVCDGTQTVTFPGNIAHTGIAGTNTLGFYAASPVIQQPTASTAGIAAIRTDTIAHAVADIQTILTALRGWAVNYGLTANTA